MECNVTWITENMLTRHKCSCGWIAGKAELGTDKEKCIAIYFVGAERILTFTEAKKNMRIYRKKLFPCLVELSHFACRSDNLYVSACEPNTFGYANCLMHSKTTQFQQLVPYRQL